MPTVTFDLHQVTTALDGPVYRVFQEITDAVNSSKAVFVFKTLTQEYSHIATIMDMRTYPDSYAQAVLDGADFYRLEEVTRDWLTVSLMVDDVNTGVIRVQLLASSLTDEEGLLEIDRTVVLTGA
jgi:hypothetical protein